MENPRSRQRCGEPRRGGRASPAAAALLGLLLLAGASGEPAPPPTLEALMRGMASTSGVRARFHEEKRLALLSEPLASRGVLYFAPPDRLVRITEAPSASRLAIDGERVVFQDVAGSEAVDLSASPVAEQFVSNFIVLWNGDLEALRARYTPHFEASGSAWTLVLRPRRRPLSDVVERVVLEGEGRAIARMELVETDGDRTTTWFEDVQTDVAFDDAELERIFEDAAAPARP